ncbi:uncharacterized protein N7511_004766 [Penicillium nucicola]|uniref:uncharacterized protein n=1 Tax=Penicillium nucicola TaxID=1850975 RepID=UPI0025454362|nr:uncharacterized protein N7511_004766 [Penicillium nucicola]KAJ5767150.1 hypothetical protein N7511_004766 [Penicillium nucicola]
MPHSPSPNLEATSPITSNPFVDPIADPPKFDIANAAAVENQRRRNGRRGIDSAKVVVPQPKKRLFFNEIGDTLADQLSVDPDQDKNQGFLGFSTLKRVHGSLTMTPIASPCVSSGDSNSRMLTGYYDTPLKSWDNLTHEYEITISPPLTKADSECHRGGSPHIRSKPQSHLSVFSLDNFFAMTAIEQLTECYGKVAHMGILDPSYRFFVNETRTAALSFKVQNGIAIVGGDPLCEPSMIPALLADFAIYRRRHSWGIAFLGVSEPFARHYAKAHGWTTMKFGRSRVLNPQTNDVLLERSGKRILTQTRQLLDRRKGGIALGVYAPATHGVDRQLQMELLAIYEAWRTDRNISGIQQAFITVYDLFALPAMMTFVYTRDPDGRPNGFAALRRLGTVGYHLDPCIAMPGSPKGISDLLVVACMALLHHADVSYLGLSFEPLDSISRGDIAGVPPLVSHLICGLYRHVVHRLPLRGKKAYHDKFRPDSSQDSEIYLVFPRCMTSPRNLLAMAHMANISLCNVFWEDIRKWASKCRKKSSSEMPSDKRRSTKENV